MKSGVAVGAFEKRGRRRTALAALFVLPGLADLGAAIAMLATCLGRNALDRLETCKTCLQLGTRRTDPRPKRRALGELCGGRLSVIDKGGAPRDGRHELREAGDRLSRRSGGAHLRDGGWWWWMVVRTVLGDA